MARDLKKKKETQKRYDMRSDRRAVARQYRVDNKEKVRTYLKEYNKKYAIENRESIKKYRKEYDRNPINKQRNKEYLNRPEIKRRKEEYLRNPQNKERTALNDRKRTLKKYNITIEQYEHLFTEQNGLCKICLKSETAIRNGKPQRLSVDHDHITKKIRGLLCNNCNPMIGYALDNPETLANAIKYLKNNIS